MAFLSIALARFGSPVQASGGSVVNVVVGSVIGLVVESVVYRRSCGRISGRISYSSRSCGRLSGSKAHDIGGIHRPQTTYLQNIIL